MANAEQPDQPTTFHFEGFDSPNTTPVPDVVFDLLAPQLSEAELRVLLYIVRRTFGFKKDSDSISLSQMVDGIRTRDGRQLDIGTGMSRRGVMKGCAGLIEKGVITVEKRLTERGDNAINIFSLRFKSPTQGVGNDVPYGRAPSAPGVGNQGAPQETVLQQTGEQPSNIRMESTQEFDSTPSGGDGGTPTGRELPDSALTQAAPSRARQRRSPEYDEARQIILAYVTDFAREFSDRASLKSSTSRAANLYQQSGVSQEAFIEAMYQARAIVKERTATVRGASDAAAGPPATKNKMAYWFSVLEDVLGLKEAGEQPLATG